MQVSERQHDDLNNSAWTGLIKVHMHSEDSANAVTVLWDNLVLQWIRKSELDGEVAQYFQKDELNLGLASPKSSTKKSEIDLLVR
jgi:hypothetical protein